MTRVMMFPGLDIHTVIKKFKMKKKYKLDLDDKLGIEAILKDLKKNPNNFPVKFRAKILWGAPILLEENMQGTPLAKWQQNSFEQAKAIADELNKRLKVKISGISANKKIGARDWRYKGYGVSVTNSGFYEVYLPNEGRFVKADTKEGIKNWIKKDAALNKKINAKNKSVGELPNHLLVMKDSLSVLKRLEEKLKGYEKEYKAGDSYAKKQYEYTLSSINNLKEKIKNEQEETANKTIGAWRKGSTVMIEHNEPKYKKLKNVRVTRVKKKSVFAKPGTFRHFATLSGYFDTTVIKDIDALKKEFYKLAKKFHPDAGGTNAEMQKLNEEYQKLFNQLLKGSGLNQEQQNNEINIDNALRSVIDNIISLENINIEIIGKWIWVSGNTYPIRNELKKAGLVFIKKDSQPYWVYKGVPSSSRGGTSMDEIVKKYGKQSVPTMQRGKIQSIGSIKKSKLRYALKKLVTAINKR